MESMLLGFSLKIWLVAFPEMRKMWGRQCEENQEVDMHCEVEMVARQLVIGIWNSRGLVSIKRFWSPECR